MPHESAITEECDLILPFSNSLSLLTLFGIKYYNTLTMYILLHYPRIYKCTLDLYWISDFLSLLLVVPW